eukprot:TRINITY_DN3762_c0_g1_i1.p1 TRINITY_DN3762_c0_g1~~TRINITY_DN3762_c0_g1_i1.p1  ORF type:complete len:450 (+),score=69.16 TRINITY_DN3762_c0_g1_i1:53-1351(+)
MSASKSECTPLRLEAAEDDVVIQDDFGTAQMRSRWCSRAAVLLMTILTALVIVLLVALDLAVLPLTLTPTPDTPGSEEVPADVGAGGVASAPANVSVDGIVEELIHLPKSFRFARQAASATRFFFGRRRYWSSSDRYTRQVKVRNADCGQSTFCFGQPHPMNATFCEMKTGKVCPCGTCCELFPSIPACPNSRLHTPSERACFPGRAEVRVRGRGRVPLALLDIGDEVLVHHRSLGLVFEPVIGFLHALPSAAGVFLNVRHELGTLRVSRKHLLFVVVGQDGRRGGRLAERLKPGDQLLFGGTDGSSTDAFEPIRQSRVLSLDVERDDIGDIVTPFGMYAPLLAAGTIIVDDVIASNYAHIEHHEAAHTAFFAARVWHSLTSRWTRGKLRGEAAAERRAAAQGERLHPLAALLAPLEHSLLPWLQGTRLLHT